MKLVVSLWPLLKNKTNCCVQFGSVGPMAITLCQSLGQNLGMLRNKERLSAGKKKYTQKVLRVTEKCTDIFIF